MTLDALVTELGKALPRDHPLVSAFQKYAELEKEPPSLDEEILSNQEEQKEIYDRVFDVLDDWGRGLKDWSEVEDELREARGRL